MFPTFFFIHKKKHAPLNIFCNHNDTAPFYCLDIPLSFLLNAGLFLQVGRSSHCQKYFQRMAAIETSVTVQDAINNSSKLASKHIKDISGKNNRCTIIYIFSIIYFKDKCVVHFKYKNATLNIHVSL